MTLPRAQVLELLKDAEEMKEVEIDLAAALSSFPTIDRGSIAVAELLLQ